ncbi:MAG: cation:dicarboxylase symporter family transporter [Eggerthellaceae bacterium]|nr:cation:dicarboxylase symporter family transporter [Eggerthellaceae bacterium]
MEQYSFSNNDIALACEEVEKFLASADVERREALRTQLTFEEALLNYQEKLGEDANFKVKFSKRLSSIKVELIVAGESFDALDKEGDEDDVIRGLLAGMGLAPTWSYKGGKNHVIFTPKKKPLSGTVKMVVAIALAIVAGALLSLLPNEIRMGANDYVLTPVTDAFMGLISAVSVPLIFFSVLGSICSMGNMQTLGKIGSKTIKTILLHAALISVFMVALGSMFYTVQWGSGGVSNFSQILDLIYDIVPSSLFEPFVTGNTLQLIFISVMIGLAMLTLSSRVSGVFSLVEQFSSIVQTIMTSLSSMLPFLIFVLFAGMISNGNLSALLGSWRTIALIALLLAAFYLANLLRIAAMKKVSPILLFKKTLPALTIALTTASSAAAFGTNVRDATKKFGIEKKLSEFGISLGQVLFSPADIAIFTSMELTFAHLYGIPITPAFLVMAIITNFLISISVPPVPGGAMMAYTLAFTQLGIPVEVMGIVLAIDALIDFPATACNVSSWQLNMIGVADSLGMLDQEKLRNEANQ